MEQRGNFGGQCHSLPSAYHGTPGHGFATFVSGGHTGHSVLAPLPSCRCVVLLQLQESAGTLAGCNWLVPDGERDVMVQLQFPSGIARDNGLESVTVYHDGVDK